MTVRRIAALFVMLLLAHLDIARAYAACAREDTHRVTEQQQTSHDHTSTPPTQDSSPLSSQAECCRAMLSCVTSLALSGDAATDDLSLERSAIIVSALGAPASLIFAPDPPPPRA